MKHLVTSGCSFTDNCHINWGGHWPNVVERHLNGTKLYNYGLGSRGNDWISKSIIYQVSELLTEGVDPNDICVIAMWSGQDRKSLFVSREETVIFPKLHNKGQTPNPSNFTDHDYGYPDENFDYNTYVCKHDGWLAGSFTCSFQNPEIEKFRKEFNKRYWTHELAVIESYEHWLRLQDFLNARNIKYFFMTYCDIMRYPARGREDGNSDLQPTEITYEKNVKHLHNMIDWEHWEYSKEHGTGFYEYCLDNNLELEDDNFHPTIESHEYFALNYVLPIIKRRFHL